MLEAYSPLGNPGRPDKESGEPEVLEDATLKRIASKHESSAVQVRQLLALHGWWHRSFVVGLLGVWDAARNCGDPQDCQSS